MQDDWRTAVVSAATEAARQDAGSVPALLQRFITDLVSPKVDWKSVLRRFVTQLSRDDYSWRRPNRKFVSQGMFLPALYSETTGPLAVVIDTSGSISNEVLNAFAAEITAIVDATRPAKLTVVYADATINHIDEFQPGEELHFAPHGGGGTDFRPAIAHFADEPPAALIYLTDLYGECGNAPDFPVLWCCVTDKVAPWGETVKLELHED
jgi:predicted metal-dependent peptidase